jgi:prophage antirepressor-like protein
MNVIRNFAFEEKLVRVVDIAGQPWFAGKDVCAALDVKDHKQALESLDDDERRGYTVPPPSGVSGRGGGEQNMIVVSMPGVFRLIFRSRKPEAERFKRWLAHEVLPQIAATGSYVPHESPAMPAIAFDDETLAIQRIKLDLVREARIQFGPARARLLWPALGLPEVPEVPGQSREDGEAVLGTLFDADDPSIQTLLRSAFAGGADAARALLARGIRIDGAGFLVASAHRWLEDALFLWPDYTSLLRALPKARAVGPTKFGPRAHRATWLPRAYVDLN